MLAIDHGYFGNIPGQLKCFSDMSPLFEYADALMLTRGMLRNCVPSELDVPIVLRVSAGASMLKELSNEEINVSIEDAIRLNVSAITCSIFVGGEYEKQTLMNLSKLVNFGQTYGVPVLAVTAVGREMVRDARYLGMASRMAAELGATFVKTYYCENFEEVTSICPVPVVIAGGKKIREKEALQMSKNAIANGAVGVDMGRNIFQSDSPLGMIKAVRAIVHEDASVDEAFEIYKQGPKGL
ncbi:MAG: 3-hydroxy-5-phosphonooxypentane-2,4-dione thiolase LsrF [Promethearchaeota archaeon Loki_b32]|nr:MAG: 3-hydroxy-5-phosphonooxypentane-2,4-dione thiolase LsrF [Candidatus Lokiarchaeota archaeon Loki_b32]